ncbi:unnamed protein product [Mytilus edulis]|uniref:Uncharacterized protein n=1 Tax=Mytilus edulis TaxID=6550 RepID=A0A8S3SIW7_MYTED|nr:unnamed protein product [Mytilus edulis]
MGRTSEPSRDNQDKESLLGEASEPSEITKVKKYKHLGQESLLGEASEPLEITKESLLGEASEPSRDNQGKSINILARKVYWERLNQGKSINPEKVRDNQVYWERLEPSEITKVKSIKHLGQESLLGGACTTEITKVKSINIWARKVYWEGLEPARDNQGKSIKHLGQENLLGEASEPPEITKVKSINIWARKVYWEASEPSEITKESLLGEASKLLGDNQDKSINIWARKVYWELLNVRDNQDKSINILARKVYWEGASEPSEITKESLLGEASEPTQITKVKYKHLGQESLLGEASKPLEITKESLLGEASEPSEITKVKSKHPGQESLLGEASEPLEITTRDNQDKSINLGQESLLGEASEPQRDNQGKKYKHLEEESLLGEALNRQEITKEGLLGEASEPLEITKVKYKHLGQESLWGEASEPLEITKVKYKHLGQESLLGRLLEIQGKFIGRASEPSRDNQTQSINIWARKVYWEEASQQSRDNQGKKYKHPGQESLLGASEPSEITKVLEPGKFIGRLLNRQEITKVSINIWARKVYWEITKESLLGEASEPLELTKIKYKHLGQESLWERLLNRQNNQGKKYKHLGQGKFIGEASEPLELTKIKYKHLFQKVYWRASKPLEITKIKMSTSWPGKFIGRELLNRKDLLGEASAPSEITKVSINIWALLLRQANKKVYWEGLLQSLDNKKYKHPGQESLLGGASEPQITKIKHKHLGQESLLGEASEPSEITKDEVVESPASQETSLPDTGGGCQESVEDPIWICFLCAQQFADQEELMTHQDKCEEEAEKEERRRFTPEPYVPPKTEDFLKALNLYDKPKEPPRVVTPVSDIDSDCEIIDVTYDESAVQTPRTPKSLMSQLSRDTHNSCRKRHLSFTQALELPEGYSSEDSESETESGSQKNKLKTPLGTLLCGVDLTSPLGQRVKKHWKIDTNYTIISGDKIEQFCSGPMKNDFVEKLRHRGESSYPIVFNKKNRRHMSKHKHSYKFNSGQRKEFMMRLKTGLTKRSRKLLEDIVKCCVKLDRVKPGVIRRWLRPKPPPPYPYAYIRRMYEQEHPIIKKIVQKPKPGPKYAKLKQITDGLRKLNRPHNLLPNQRMFSKVVHNPDGSTSMRMVYQHPTSQVRPQFGNVPGNRRKQTFNQSTVRQIDPDDIEIIELSSSDEEGDKIPQQPPQTASLPPKGMTTFKNITGVATSPQIARRMAVPNSQKLFRSHQQHSPGMMSPRMNFYPRLQQQVSRPISPSNTRERIFQGVRGILSPSSLQNKSHTAIHSSPPGASTCKELMQNSKPVSGFVNRAMFKETPQILRTSQNSPSKSINKNSPKAAGFPGYVRMDYTVPADSTTSSVGASFNVKYTNGSPVISKTMVQPVSTNRSPLITQPKPRDPIMESDVIVIDDED